MRRVVAIAGLMLAAGPAAHGSGFQLQEQTASGLGLAYSGMPAAAQDAGAAFWNPAALTLLPGTQLAAAVHYIDTSFDFTSTGSSYDAYGDGGNAGSGTWVPALYGKLSLTPHLAAGLAVNAPFGLRTDWDNPWAGSFHALKSEVKTLNINPSIACRLSERISVGAGLSYERLEATLTNAATPALPTAQGRLQGDDWGWGWNVAALFTVDDATRIGLTYRSAIGYTIAGDLTFDNAALAPRASGVKANLRLPRTAAIGAARDVSPNLKLLADFTWTGWDSIQALQVIATSGALNGQVVSNTALNFRNSWRAGFGGEYRLSSAWLLRAGLAYDRSPVADALRTPRLPDEDRKWLAGGVRFEPNGRWSLDAGYAHLWVREASSNLAPTGIVPGVLRGRYDSSSNVLAAQASFRF